jgi:cell division protein ZapA
MSEVKISLNGRIYDIGCDPGQEPRVLELAAYIDQRLQQIARSGAAYSDAHLFVLTSLVLADELFDAKEGHGNVRGAAGKSAPARAETVNKEEEQALSRVLEQITKRVDGIAAKLQAA